MYGRLTYNPEVVYLKPPTTPHPSVIIKSGIVHLKDSKSMVYVLVFDFLVNSEVTHSVCRNVGDIK